MIRLEKGNWSLASLALVICFIPLMLLDGGLDNLVVCGVNIVLLATVIVLFWKQELTVTWQTPGFWLLIFTLWGMISFIWSIEKYRTMVESTQLLMGVLIFYVAKQVPKEQDEKLVNILSLIGVGSAVYSTVMFITKGIGNGTAANANPYAMMLGMVILITWGQAVRKSKVKWTYLVACVIMATQMLVLSCRTCCALLLLVTPLLFLYLPKKQCIKKIGETILLTGLTVGLSKIVLAIKLGQKAKLSEVVVNSGSMHNSFWARISFWKQALRLFKNKPLQGYGLGTFFASDNILAPDSGINARFVHNHYLQIMSELGAVGIVLFGIMIIATLLLIYKQIISKQNKTFGYIAAWFACMGHMVADFTFSIPVCMGLLFFNMAIITRDNIASTNNKPMKNIVKRIAIICSAVFIFYSGFVATGYQWVIRQPIDNQMHAMKQMNIICPINASGYDFVVEKQLDILTTQKNEEVLKDALKNIECALALNPYEDAYYLKFGYLNILNRDMEKATWAFIKSCEYSGANIKNFGNLAQFYLTQEKINEANEALKQGVQLGEKMLSLGNRPNLKEDIQWLKGIQNEIAK